VVGKEACRSLDVTLAQQSFQLGQSLDQAVQVGLRPASIHLVLMIPAAGLAFQAVCL
jgi:hypothetical protein